MKDSSCPFSKVSVTTDTTATSPIKIITIGGKKYKFEPSEATGDTKPIVGF